MSLRGTPGGGLREGRRAQQIAKIQEVQIDKPTVTWALLGERAAEVVLRPLPAQAFQDKPCP